jgi:hypothetical protein
MHHCTLLTAVHPVNPLGRKGVENNINLRCSGCGASKRRNITGIGALPSAET